LRHAFRIFDGHRIARAVVGKFGTKLKPLFGLLHHIK